MNNDEKAISVFKKYIAESLEILEIAGIEKKHLLFLRKEGGSYWKS